MAKKPGPKPKHTLAFAKKEMKAILKEVLEDEKIVYINQLFVGRSYSRQRYYDWQKNYPNQKGITDTARKVNEILESRIVVGSINGGFSAKMSTLLLTNKFGWKVKTESAVTVKGVEDFLDELDD